MTTETPKLCPFRFMKALNSFDNIYESWHEADLDNFMCLQEKCAMWRIGMIKFHARRGPDSKGRYEDEFGEEIGGWCGVAGKEEIVA